MYSQDETVNAVLRFYQAVLRHPYLNNSTLIVPPVNGWTSITIEGKNNTVLDLLCQLLYLRPESAYKELLINWETIPICYSDNLLDRLPSYPLLPAHCIHLARAQSYLGTSLILDTNEGIITEFCAVGSHITVPYEEYEALPEAEKWKAHRTTPTTKFFGNWTQRYEKLVCMLVPNPIGQPVTGRFCSRAVSSAEVEELLTHQGQLEPLNVQDNKSGGDDDREESELDSEQNKTRERKRRHVADVFNLYLRHGWPDHFDKERCRAELLELEERKDANQRRQMDEMNPDAALFD